MPRQGPPGAIANEINLARRIAVEREARGWSYEALSRAVADAGAPMQPSTLFRIEKGEPPRAVRVPELIAFARVFGLSIDDLLEPIELVEQRRAKELVEQQLRAMDDLVNAVLAIMDASTAGFAHSMSADPELREYVNHQMQAHTEAHYDAVTHRVRTELSDSDYADTVASAVGAIIGASAPIGHVRAGGSVQRVRSTKSAD